MLHVSPTAGPKAHPRKIDCFLTIFRYEVTRLPIGLRPQSHGFVPLLSWI